jgi:SAM-dependent methyltransferase
LKCRHCQSHVTLPFLDLGYQPPSNNYLDQNELHDEEEKFKLCLMVCESCWLVQTLDFVVPELIFSEKYAYFSSFSETWLAHASDYVEKMINRFGLNSTSLVAEIAANDGYLLQFVQAASIPCYGVEPSSSTADAAKAKGIEIIQRFFGLKLANELVEMGKQVDLIVANNVIAHVPDINDFLQGCTQLLKPQGVATFEFPHLLRMVEQTQFDTAYQEHYSYLSFFSIERICAKNGLQIFDVEQLPTHGGSLRIFAQRHTSGQKPRHPNVEVMRTIEYNAGINTASFYGEMQLKAETVKDNLLSFLKLIKTKGLKVGAYGAAAKGNTLLNFANIDSNLLPYVVDKSPAKFGKFMPGSRIPIVRESHLLIDKPDLILILPWNLSQEIVEQLSYSRDWGAQLFIVIPTIKLID